MALVGFKVNDQRPEDDFYPTPPEATLSLLAHVNFPEDVTILEPSCGDGAISKIFEERGYKVVSRDLHNNGYGESGQDFLKTEDWPEGKFWIVTNPPYNIAGDYIKKCLQSPAERVILMLKWDYMGGGKSREGVLDTGTLFRKLLYKERLPFWPKNYVGNKKGRSPTYYSAWYIWDKNYRSPHPDESITRRISLKDR